MSLIIGPNKSLYAGNHRFWCQMCCYGTRIASLLCLPIYLHIYHSTYLPIYPSIHLPVNLCKSIIQTSSMNVESQTHSCFPQYFPARMFCVSPHLRWISLENLALPGRRAATQRRGYCVTNNHQVLQSDPFEVVKWPFLGWSDLKHLELMVEKVSYKQSSILWTVEDACTLDRFGMCMSPNGPTGSLASNQTAEFLKTLEILKLRLWVYGRSLH